MIKCRASSLNDLILHFINLKLITLLSVHLLHLFSMAYTRARAQLPWLVVPHHGLDLSQLVRLDRLQSILQFCEASLTVLSFLVLISNRISVHFILSRRAGVSLIDLLINNGNITVSVGLFFLIHFLAAVARNVLILYAVLAGCALLLIPLIIVWGNRVRVNIADRSQRRIILNVVFRWPHIPGDHQQFTLAASIASFGRYLILTYVHLVLSIIWVSSIFHLAEILGWGH